MDVGPVLFYAIGTHILICMTKNIFVRGNYKMMIIFSLVLPNKPSFLNNALSFYWMSIYYFDVEFEAFLEYTSLSCLVIYK